ncbi:MAG: ROK family protein [Planctomycetes bacterium]|nr:ROK family protein [Planctomycetota bacterium]
MTVHDRPFWLGFDLGGTKMLAVVFDHRFRPIARKRRRTKGREGEKQGVARIIQTIQLALDEARLERGRLAGIGVGCPGPVDRRGGVIREAVNLGWTDVSLRQILHKEFACPVEIVNDVDAGVYGENRFGAAIGARTAVGVFPGTGIGGGCVYEGDILTGARISCMEIGHVRVRAEGKRCGCGGRGCLETEASRLAISAEAAKAAFRGDAPHLARLVGTNLSDIRSSTLAQAIAAGDGVIESIVRDAAEAIGDAVAALVHLVAPDIVVLGGGLVEAMPDLYVRTVKERAKAGVMRAYVNAFRVVAAKLGDDATAMGAAAWVEKRNAPAPEPAPR